LRGNPLEHIRKSSFIFAIPLARRLLFLGHPSHVEGIFTPALILMRTVSTSEIELRIGGKEGLKGALAEDLP
jgi:hypothetical protein